MKKPEVLGSDRVMMSADASTVLTPEEAFQVLETVLKIQHLIGTPYVASVKRYISALTGRQKVAGPDDSCTDVDRERIRIDVDGARFITEFWFG